MCSSDLLSEDFDNIGDNYMPDCWTRIPANKTLPAVVSGGKLIVVTGVSDPVFSAKDQVAWFRQMQQDTKNAAGFSRLFMIPSMNHCGGGQAFNDFDPLTALENWHDNNQAPAHLLAQGKSFPGKQMPICAWPRIATYKSGDTAKAESSECQSAKIGRASCRERV